MSDNAIIDVTGKALTLLKELDHIREVLLNFQTSLEILSTDEAYIEGICDIDLFFDSDLQSGELLCCLTTMRNTMLIQIRNLFKYGDKTKSKKRVTKKTTPVKQQMPDLGKNKEHLNNAFTHVGTMMEDIVKNLMKDEEEDDDSEGKKNNPKNKKDEG